MNVRGVPQDEAATAAETLGHTVVDAVGREPAQTSVVFIGGLVVRAYHASAHSKVEELVAALPNVKVRPQVADLGTDAGVEAVADVCAREELTMLVNNAGVAHYMPFVEIPANKASELLHVKVVALTMRAQAAAPGIVARGEGIINVSSMLAFSGRRGRLRACGREARTARRRVPSRPRGIRRPGAAARRALPHAMRKRRGNAAWQ